MCYQCTCARATAAAVATAPTAVGQRSAATLLCLLRLPWHFCAHAWPYARACASAHANTPTHPIAYTCARSCHTRADVHTLMRERKGERYTMGSTWFQSALCQGHVARVASGGPHSVRACLQGRRHPQSDTAMALGSGSIPQAHGKRCLHRFPCPCPVPLHALLICTTPPAANEKLVTGAKCTSDVTGLRESGVHLSGLGERLAEALFAAREVRRAAVGAGAHLGVCRSPPSAP